MLNEEHKTKLFRPIYKKFSSVSYMAVARIPESIRYNKIIEAAAVLIGDKESTKEKMPQL